MTARMLSALLPALAAMIAGPAIARSPQTLAPSTAWTLSYDDDSCRLMRIFGEGEEQTAFFFERYEPSAQQFMLVAGRPLGPLRLANSVKLRFAPGHGEMDAKVRRGDLGSLSPALMTMLNVLGDEEQDAFDDVAKEQVDTFSSVAALDEERFADVDSLVIGLRGGRELILQLGKMSEPMAEMRTCTRELVTHWGIDVERHEDLSRKVEPAGSPQNWVRSSDYPKAAANTSQQGIVQFRLMVNENGEPTSCHIQKSTRPQEFDDAICRVMMSRAKFEPALDAEGAPMPSYFVQQAVFQMAR